MSRGFGTLAALFSPYVFGLSDDRSFDETYQEWQRSTDALEPATDENKASKIDLCARERQ
jgi:hypothetical protein